MPLPVALPHPCSHLSCRGALLLVVSLSGCHDHIPTCRVTIARCIAVTLPPIALLRPQCCLSCHVAVTPPPIVPPRPHFRLSCHGAPLPVVSLSCHHTLCHCRTVAYHVAVALSHVVSLSHRRLSCCCRAVARRVAVAPSPVMSLSCRCTLCRCHTIAHRVPLAPSHIVSLSHRHVMSLSHRHTSCRGALLPAVLLSRSCVSCICAAE